jgi:hypothetical protein
MADVIKDLTDDQMRTEWTGRTAFAQDGTDTADDTADDVADDAGADDAADDTADDTADSDADGTDA